MKNILLWAVIIFGGIFFFKNCKKMVGLNMDVKSVNVPFTGTWSSVSKDDRGQQTTLTTRIVSDGKRFRLDRQVQGGAYQANSDQVMVFDGESIHVRSSAGGSSSRKLSEDEIKKMKIWTLDSDGLSKEGRGDTILGRETVHYKFERSPMNAFVESGDVMIDKETGLILKQVSSIRLGRGDQVTRTDTTECTNLQVGPINESELTVPL